MKYKTTIIILSFICALSISGCSSPMKHLEDTTQALNEAIGAPNGLLYRQVRDTCDPEIRNNTSFIKPTSELRPWRTLFEISKGPEFKITEENITYISYGYSSVRISAAWFGGSKYFKSKAICVTDRSGKHFISIKIDVIEPTEDK